MAHLTQDELHSLITKTYAELQTAKEIPPATLSIEEQEQLKMYIPMQLGEESAKRMMSLVTDIREGKRAPMSEEDRAALNKKNMDESLINFLTKLASATEDELAAVYEMCETIRASRTIY